MVHHIRQDIFLCQICCYQGEQCTSSCDLMGKQNGLTCRSTVCLFFSENSASSSMLANLDLKGSYVCCCLATPSVALGLTSPCRLVSLIVVVLQKGDCCSDSPLFQNPSGPKNIPLDWKFICTSACYPKNKLTLKILTCCRTAKPSGQSLESCFWWPDSAQYLHSYYLCFWTT